MSIETLRAAEKALGSQQAVATKLGISRQRLNNWLQAEKVPFGWDRIIADRRKELTAKRKVK